MKSLRARLTLWFALSLIGVVAVLMLAADWHLDYELRQEKWERTHPAHPDWVLHGSFTDQEVHDILGELMRFWLLVGTPVVGLAVVAGYLMARQSTRPVEALNRQLAGLGAANLGERVRVPAGDPEFVELVRRLNQLLDRLEVAFGHLQEYTTQVAHELRTPLQLIRLQIEAHASTMNPELAEGLAEELARLSNVVETALTIARAEQGRLELAREAVVLRPFLEDLLDPFARLAGSEGRRLVWDCPADCVVHSDRPALKQILINLVTNALKHGEGDIHLCVRERHDRIALLVGNRRASASAAGRAGLGIGLRLVRALAQQLDDASLQLHSGAWYWARLSLPGSRTA